MTSGDREGEKFVNQMMYLLTAPGITMPGYEDLSRLHKDDVTLQRLARHKEIFENQQCTELEAMLYISTASFVHPLDHDWIEIYMYLFKRWSPEKAKAADIEGPDELNRWPQQEDLAKLRRWIYRRQMHHLRAKMGNPNRRALQKEKEELDDQQQKLF